MNVHRRQWLITGVAATALAAGAWYALREERELPGASTVAPMFALTFDDAQGHPQPLSQWQGRWLLVNFWATWCAPCVEEMPMLQQAAHDDLNRGVAFVGVGIDNAAAIRRFQTELKIDIPLLVAGARGTELARLLGNESGALPYTVLIDPAGRVIRSRLGLLKPELLRSWLEAGPTHSGG